jgi:hypothetical protein
MRLKYVKEKIVLHSKDDQGSAWTLMRSLLFSQTQGRTKKVVRGHYGICTLCWSQTWVLHSKDDPGSARTMMPSLLFTQTHGRTKKVVRGFTAFVHCVVVKHECYTAKMIRGQLKCWCVHYFLVKHKVAQKKGWGALRHLYIVVKSNMSAAQQRWPGVSLDADTFIRF